MILQLFPVEGAYEQYLEGLVKFLKEDLRHKNKLDRWTWFSELSVS